MRRLFSLFLVLLIICSCVIPASADEYQGSWLIDILDYGSVSDDNVFGFTTSRKDTISLSRSISFNYVDILLYSSASVDQFSIFRNDESVNLYIDSVDSGIYRIFGNVPNRVGSNVDFEISSVSSSSVSVQIYSFKVGRRATGSSFLDGFMSFNSTDLNFTDRVDIVTPGEPVRYNFRVPGSFNYLGIENAVYFCTVDWEGYDFVTFDFSCKYYSVRNFKVTLGSSGNNVTIPYTIQAPNNIDTDKPQYYTITCDLRGIDRDKYVNSVLTVFNVFYLDAPDSVDVTYLYEYIFYSVQGVIDIDDDPTSFWLMRLFNSLKDWFTSLSNTIKSEFKSLSSLINQIINGSTAQNNAADSFNDNIDDQSDELEDLTSDLNNVTRPPISDVNLSTNTMVKPNIVTITTLGIGDLLNNIIISRVFIMALTFALAGFILFGKR